MHEGISRHQSDCSGIAGDPGGAGLAGYGLIALFRVRENPCPTRGIAPSRWNRALLAGRTGACDPAAASAREGGRTLRGGGRFGRAAERHKRRRSRCAEAERLFAWRLDAPRHRLGHLLSWHSPRIFRRCRERGDGRRPVPARLAGGERAGPRPPLPQRSCGRRPARAASGAGGVLRSLRRGWHARAACAARLSQSRHAVCRRARPGPGWPSFRARLRL